MPAAAAVYSDVTKIRLLLADGCLIVAVGSVPDDNPERWIANETAVREDHQEFRKPPKT
jgi:hypothetical protein